MGGEGLVMRQFERQKGATLIVALIILLVLTILGFSGSQSVLLQEKMTFSVQDSHIALQSAELALSEAEAFIANTVVTKTDFEDDGQNATYPGLYTLGNGPENIFSAANWTSANSQVASTSVHADVAAPRFYIEDTGVPGDEDDDAGSVNILGYGQTTGQGDINTFRVVARGVGRSANTERFIIGFFGKRL